MSYRGRGGYRGDLSFFDDTSGVATSDMGLGADNLGLPDLGGGGGEFSIQPASDTGSSIWQDIGGFLGGAASLPGLAGAGLAGATLTGVKQLLGGSAGPGVGAGYSPKAAKALAKTLQRKLRGGGGGSGRRMNPGNFRALRRSMRRLSAFEHAAKRVFKFTHPPRGHSGFKFKRRRRKC